MTVRLRRMRANEFPAYLGYFIPDYAAEISANYDLDSAAAWARAEREVASDLTDGVATEGQVLLCMSTGSHPERAPVGYVWCAPNDDARTVFINDFYVFPDHRGAGVGRGALAALERWFADLGHQELRLRVAADNDRAQKLYLAAGYRVTGINMRKGIGEG